MLSDKYTVVDLARDSHELDLRNRVVHAEDTIRWATAEPVAIPPWMCQVPKCGNTLVISDSGGTCRQCRLGSRPV